MAPRGRTGCGNPQFSWLPGEDGAGLQEERGGAVCPTRTWWLVATGVGRAVLACVRLTDKDGRVVLVLAYVRLVEEDGVFWSASATTSEV